ncbi:3-methyl-2-oxobutanoate hydroxymethyltransferase [Opitutales bacterium ASA1]|uniref:3-methyl-2-oxobutanoate hydroxymethyltransferase n=1 Tax=Congregicoccus parvus TaxID=3081749 RepID=UPI002B28D0D8|nr:3-methyl-2-oxobutanoate hydroxymethyltransferase [Opitutales bacterium ASA1]
MKGILDFARARRDGRPIGMVTSYDAWSARLAAQAGVDCLLVGDSVAMVVHGFADTLHATPEMMVAHTAAVRRGAPELFVVADMPFLTFRKGPETALDVAGALMRAGASAVKLEGVRGHERTVEQLVGSGIPVMGHLGLTPQSVHQLGGYRVQGRSAEDAARLLEDARTLQALGAFALVLECVPEQLATDATEALAIPTIGIGSGPRTSGQVLVLHDLLGLSDEFRPRFARRYLEGHALVRDALQRYVTDVREARFPAREEVLC